MVTFPARSGYISTKGPIKTRTVISENDFDTGSPFTE
jgi:hypothetical protein